VPINQILNVPFLIFHNMDVISINSIFDSNFGFLVMYLVIICFWWSWHI